MLTSCAASFSSWGHHIIFIACLRQYLPMFDGSSFHCRSSLQPIFHSQLICVKSHNLLNTQFSHHGQHLKSKMKPQLHWTLSVAANNQHLSYTMLVMGTRLYWKERCTGTWEKAGELANLSVDLNLWLKVHLIWLHCIKVLCQFMGAYYFETISPIC